MIVIQLWQQLSQKLSPPLKFYNYKKKKITEQMLFPFNPSSSESQQFSSNIY